MIQNVRLESLTYVIIDNGRLTRLTRPAGLTRQGTGRSWSHPHRRHRDDERRDDDRAAPEEHHQAAVAAAEVGFQDWVDRLAGVDPAATTSRSVSKSTTTMPTTIDPTKTTTRAVGAIGGPLPLPNTIFARKCPAHKPTAEQLPHD